MNRLAAILTVLFLALQCSSAWAQARPTGKQISGDDRPRQLEGIEISDRVGETIPADIQLVDQDGESFRVGDQFDGENPVIVVLAYYECPMLCTLVLNGVMNGMKEADQTLGEDYDVLVVSFDPRDTPAMAKTKRDNYVEAFGGEVGDAWTFATGTEEQVRRLADAVGYGYRWDPQTEQYAHAAGAFIVSPNRVLARTLHGISFPGDTLTLALTEASEGKLTHSPMNALLLFCYQYDPDAGSYVLAGTRLMKIGGVVTLAAIGMLLAFLFRNERRKRERQRTADEE